MCSVCVKKRIYSKFGFQYSHVKHNNPTNKNKRLSVVAERVCVREVKVFVKIVQQLVVIKKGSEAEQNQKQTGFVRIHACFYVHV